MARSLSISSPAAGRPEAASSSVFVVRRPAVPHPMVAGGFEGPPMRQPAAFLPGRAASSGVLPRRSSVVQDFPDDFDRFHVKPAC